MRMGVDVINLRHQLHPQSLFQSNTSFSESIPDTFEDLVPQYKSRYSADGIHRGHKCTEHIKTSTPTSGGNVSAASP